MTTEATAIEEPGYIRLLRELAADGPLDRIDWICIAHRDLREDVESMGWVDHEGDTYAISDLGRAELAAWDALAAVRLLQDMCSVTGGAKIDAT